MHRLQGKEFHELKPELTMLGYQVSANGNIRAIMKKKTATQVHIGVKSTKYMYAHWLNPEETERFKKSTYFKITKPLTDDELYPCKEEQKRQREEYLAKRQAKYNSLPSELIDGIKKLKGLGEYHNDPIHGGTNICEGDVYFAMHLENTYGSDNFNLAYEMTR